jgi:uncharacterized protein (DUF1778 family)
MTDYFSYVYRMPRPKKKPEERKSAELRVPVTEEQKSLIIQAAGLDGLDVATWVRPIILNAAKKRVERETPRKPKGS